MHEHAKPAHGTDFASPEEEREVILRLQRGDRSAAATLYSWYATLLFRSVIVPRLPNLDHANDCLADTYVTAFERIGSYEIHPEWSIFHWLRRIAINKVMDVYRHQGRSTTLVDNTAEDANVLVQPAQKPGRNLDVDDTRRMVETSLSRLSERYATVLRLRLIEERSREECAMAMGITVGNLDVLVHRAAKAFREVYPP